MKQFIFWYDEDLDPTRFTINIYHDGELVEHHEHLNVNEGTNLINRLKKQGYEKAFLPEDVESVKQEYEYMLAHMLVSK